MLCVFALHLAKKVGVNVPAAITQSTSSGNPRGTVGQSTRRLPLNCTSTDCVRCVRYYQGRYNNELLLVTKKEFKTASVRRIACPCNDRRYEHRDQRNYCFIGQELSFWWVYTVAQVSGCNVCDFPAWEGLLSGLAGARLRQCSRPKSPQTEYGSQTICDRSGFLLT